MSGNERHLRSLAETFRAEAADAGHGDAETLALAEILDAAADLLPQMPTLPGQAAVLVLRVATFAKLFAPIEEESTDGR